MKKIIKGLISIFAGCMIFGAAALADEGAAILETYTGDSYISVYAKGVGESAGDGIQIQIATTEAEQVAAQLVSEMDKPMKTLIMLDNSISIQQQDREKIAELLQNIISSMDNEEICLATFSEGTSIVADYSSDYKTLKQAVDSIEYQDQETYLTDVLYDLISAQYIQNDEDVYRRIIVISDGVDNKSIGYTKEELSSLLKDNPVPIYTIGCLNKNNNNNEQLKNMFAISRQTNADYFTIDEVEDLFEISDALDADADILKLIITPTETMLDGSKKTVKITFAGGTSLEADIAMPQQIYVEDVEEPETETQEETETESEPETVEDEEDTIFGIDTMTFLIIVICVMAVIAIICIVIIVVRVKKKNRPSFEPIDSSALNEMQNSADISNDRTLMLDPFQNNDANHDGTVMLWNQSTTYQVVLTDINSPAKSFRVPLNNVIIIGRKADMCDIAIAYEKSISSKHCEISVSGGKFYVTDLQSSNGTYLNGSRVLAKTEIFSGNTLKLGRLELRFEVR